MGITLDDGEGQGLLRLAMSRNRFSNLSIQR